MAVSAAESPTSPDTPVPGEDAGLRASDAERDEAAGELGEHFAAGRLSHDTFMHRMNSALRARRRSDLPPLLADLPRRQGPRGWLSAGRDGAGAMVGRVRRALPPALARVAPPSGRPLVRAPRPRPAPPVLSFPRGAGTVFTIGRDRECDLAIDDMTVSRVHARLERAESGWLLTDAGSTNGTRVNGWRVRGAVRVRPGDVVRFGATEYALGASDER